MKMKSLVIGVALLTFTPYLEAADETVSGNLTVTGNTEIDGGLVVEGSTTLQEDLEVHGSVYGADNAWFAVELNLGSLEIAPNVFQPAMSIGGGVNSMQFDIADDWGAYTWTYNSADSARLKMELDYDNRLFIYDANEMNWIILSVDEGSYFPTNVVFDGGNNSMPNQAVSGDDSVLTKGLADDLYPSHGGMLKFYDTSTEEGMDTFVVGHNNALYAGAQRGLLLGSGNSTKGYFNLAIGSNNYMNGNLGGVLGNNNLVNGWHNYSIGLNNYVSVGESIAFNYENDIFSTRSLVAGYHNTIRSGYTAMFGRLARDLMESWNWSWSDRMFVVGNGEFLNANNEVTSDLSATIYDPTYTPHSWLNNRPRARRSDAFVVRKDGRTEIIAHQQAVAESKILSVMDGTNDPESPETVFSVDKEGDVFSAGDVSISGSIISGNGHEFTPGSGVEKPSYVGAHGFNDAQTGDDAAMFVVGGGEESDTANAMVVRKNGTVEVAKTLRVPAAGDLSMGDFTAGTDPSTILQPAP